MFDEFWPLANFNQSNVVFVPLFIRSKISDIAPGVTEFFRLTVAQQRTFESVRKFYAKDHKQYSRQQNAFTKIRKYIQDTMTFVKRLNLKTEDSVKDWIKIFRDLVKPTPGQMRLVAKKKYQTVFRIKAKPQKWLNKWKRIIADIRQYNFSEFKNDIWLSKMSNWMKSYVSKIVYDLNSKNNYPDDWLITEYFKLLHEVRQYLAEALKLTIRGNVFQASVNDEEDLLEETATISSKRKRGNITSASAFNKRQEETCFACERKGHGLNKC